MLWPVSGEGGDIIPVLHRRDDRVETRVCRMTVLGRLRVDDPGTQVEQFSWIPLAPRQHGQQQESGYQESHGCIVSKLTEFPPMSPAT